MKNIIYLLLFSSLYAIGLSIKMAWPNGGTRSRSAQVALLVGVVATFMLIAYLQDGATFSGPVAIGSAAFLTIVALFLAWRIRNGVLDRDVQR